MESNETDAAGSSSADVKKYKCPQCPREYKHHQNLSSHMRIHDVNKRFQCQLCQDRIFATKRDFQRHMLIHTGEKLHQCPTCKLCFGRPSNLKAHQYIHVKEKTLKCPECRPVERYFRTPKQLSDHMLVHRKEKQFECSDCHKGFYRQSDLKRHQQKSHNKSYQCDMCGETFVRCSSLKKHVGKHVGKKPYKCGKCDASFTDAYYCSKHQERCQVLDKEHKCPQCPKRYSHKRGLKTHMKIHNNGTSHISVFM